MPDSRMVIEERDERHLVPRKVVVVSEPGRTGATALAQAAALAVASSSLLTVVATARQSTTSCRSCGGVSPLAYISAVREDVAEGLRDAIVDLTLTTTTSTSRC